jgi:serine/threonine protein kinase
MSPEQADGKNGRIGPATDVYQCAVVLYELLAGRLPYDIEDRSAMSLLKAVLFDARSPLGAVAPRFSGAMDRAINRALSADPADRPQTAALFAEQLRQAAQELRRG